MRCTFLKWDEGVEKTTPFGRFLCISAFAVGTPLATLVGSCVISTRDKCIEKTHAHKMIGIYIKNQNLMVS